MKDTGRVVKTDGSRVLLWAGPLGACFGCMAHDCAKASREFWAVNRYGLALEAGMWVRLEPLASRARKQALLAVFFPLLLGIGLYFGLKTLFPGFPRDDITLFAVLGFFSAALLVLLINSRRFSKTGPEIIGIVEDAPAFEGESCGDGI